MSARTIEFEAGDTLENLIHQFTDPYAFLRELIQNSLDAGSGRVDVSTEFRASEKDGSQGLAILAVEDTGEGMTRQIIDTQLTRLFSSSKEGDLTKIGKFGIGFVSVFALGPTYVVVDTGRDGESWRILFHQDRHFERIELEMPVDGTRIQVLKPVRGEEFEEMRRRARETVVYWCKHCDVDIHFDGERINQPFSLDSPLAVRHAIPGTEIVAAPSTEERPFFGFYNRGLTLSEGHQALVPGVEFKLKSRYLEHTLTRDNVLRDENYDKAMAALREAVDGPLRDALFRLAGEEAPDELLGALSFRLADLPRVLEETPLLPALHGPPWSIARLRAAAPLAELPWDAAPSPASEQLSREGTPVLRWAGPEQSPGLGALLREVLPGARPVQVTRTWAAPVLIPDLSADGQELLREVERLLQRAGSPHRRLCAASFLSEGSFLQDRLYLVQEKPGSLYRESGSPERRRWWAFGGAEGTLVLNVEHPLVRPHFDLKADHPELAAYLLAKCLTLDDGLDPETETRLVEATMERSTRP